MNTLESLKDALLDAVFEIEAIQKEEPQDYEPTDEEISMNVSGTPDLHERNPELFAKMAKFYDETREPFTADSWMRVGWTGKDTRPLKPIEIDGIWYSVIGPSTSPDFHLIVKGAIDVTADPVLAPIDMDAVEAFSDEAYERIRQYQGGLNKSLTYWPRQYREVYEESH